MVDLWKRVAIKKKFKNVAEVRDPEVVIDTSPEPEAPEPETQPAGAGVVPPPPEDRTQVAVAEPESIVIAEPLTVPAYEPYFGDIPKFPAMTTVRIPDEAERQRVADAGLVLLSYLPEETQQLIKDAQEQLSIPIWQMMLGYVMRARERDELFHPIQLSMWEFTLPANAPRPCASCGLDFTSRWGEAKYCCNPCHFGKLSKFGHDEECPTRKVLVA